MEKNKKWFLQVISSAAALLLVISCLTVAADPFSHYHKPSEKIPYEYFASDQIYLNPGIVKHFDYDALITGSSMTENFRVSYFYEALGVNAVKVSYSGARSKDMNIIIKRALESNPNLKTVYLGLDLYMLKGADTEETRHPHPEYLYNSNPFDDVNYLFNKDILFKKVLPSLIGAAKGLKSESFDQYSVWDHLVVYGQNGTLKSSAGMEKADVSADAAKRVIKDADSNLKKNFIPLIEAYPDVKFVIFFPPFSILYWYFRDTESELNILEHAVNSLIKYDNTELFMFMNNLSIIYNLYNYTDPVHYSADINIYMTNCFKNGTHLLTAENSESELQAMRTAVENFDYGLIFGGSNPFITENNFLKYTEKINSSRYVVLIASRSDNPAGASDIFAGMSSDFGLDSENRGRSYAAVFSGGNAVFEQADEERILYSGNDFGLSVSIVCEDRGGESYTEIVIDGIRYAYGQRGVSIVVYDKVTKRVLDNIYLNIQDGSIQRK